MCVVVCACMYIYVVYIYVVYIGNRKQQSGRSKPFSSLTPRSGAESSAPKLPRCFFFFNNMCVCVCVCVVCVCVFYNMCVFVCVCVCAYIYVCTYVYYNNDKYKLK